MPSVLAKMPSSLEMSGRLEAILGQVGVNSTAPWAFLLGGGHVLQTPKEVPDLLRGSPTTSRNLCAVRWPRWPPTATICRPPTAPRPRPSRQSHRR